MQQAPVKHDRFVSLRFKLLVAFTLVFSLIFAAAFYWFYAFSTNMAIGRITEDLVDTMQAAVKGIDGDQLASLYRDASVRADGYTDDPRYWEQVKWLATVHSVEPRAMLYTYVKGDKPGELVFITSNGAVMDPPFGAKFRESWVTEHAEPNLGGLTATTLQTKDRAACAYGDAGCKLEPYTDDWGQWVSAFSPIKDSKGEVVAALGMDFQADYVKQVQDSIRRQILWAFAVTYLVLFVVVYFLSRFLTNPLILLTQSAEQIGEGDYAGSHERLAKTSGYTVFSDETTRLSQVFEIMVDKVYQREQTLRKQVEELKIEIDEAKRQKEVGEIVDSDFFRDLQLKARNMRSRRESQGEDVESTTETGL
jgi:HAMP domain-containing protein